jgi:hypothetical protein
MRLPKNRVPRISSVGTNITAEFEEDVPGGEVGLVVVPKEVF